MQGEDGEALPGSSLLQRQVIADARFLGDGQKMSKRIDHDVANEIDRFAGTAFLEEMADGVFFGDEEIVGEGIGEDAINFFGHGTVKTAKTGFDVGNWNAEFHGGEGDGDSGIDVADDEDEIGFAFDQNWLDTLENFGGLGGVGAGTDFEIDVGGWNTHLTEKNVGKRFIVVLAGMDENGINLRMALHLANERSNFGRLGRAPTMLMILRWRLIDSSRVMAKRSIAFGIMPFGALKRPFAPKKH